MDSDRHVESSATAFSLQTCQLINMSVVAFLKHIQASPVLTLQDVSVWIDANTLAWVVFDLKG